MADPTTIKLHKGDESVLVEPGSEADLAFRDAGYIPPAMKGSGTDHEAAKRLAAGRDKDDDKDDKKPHAAPAGKDGKL